MADGPCSCSSPAPTPSLLPFQPCSLSGRPTQPVLPPLPSGPALLVCTALPMSPKPSPGDCHRAVFCQPSQSVPAFQDLGKNSRINVNKSNRTAQCHHPAMKCSRSWAGWWEIGIRCCLPPPPQPPCGLVRTGCVVVSSSHRAISALGSHFWVSLGEGAITFARKLKVKPLWWICSSRSK